MAQNEAVTFWIVFCIIMAINLIIPPIAQGLGTSLDQHDSGDADAAAAPAVADFFTLTIVNLFTVPFWTFGLNSWINLFIMIPLRVLAYLLLIRLIRGNG